MEALKSPNRRFSNNDAVVQDSDNLNYEWSENVPLDKQSSLRFLAPKLERKEDNNNEKKHSSVYIKKCPCNNSNSSYKRYSWSWKSSNS